MVYAFSLYSEDLQTQFNLTQHEIDFLGTASNWGGNVGWHIGPLFAYCGPRYTMLLAGFLGSSCWLLYWALLSAGKDAVRWVPYSVLFLLSFLLGHAQLIADCTSVSIIDAHFPEHRGRALGLTKAFVGLSGSLVTMVYQAHASKSRPSLLSPLASLAPRLSRSFIACAASRTRAVSLLCGALRGCNVLSS